MGQEDVVDQRQFSQWQVGHPCPRVDQDVTVHENRCGAQVAPTNASTTTQDPDSHAGPTESLYMLSLPRVVETAGR